MKGFLYGTIALVALEVLLSNKATNAVTSGGSVFSTFLTRFLSPNVAGIPQTAKASTSTTGASTTAPSTSSTVTVASPGVTPTTGNLLLV